MDFTQKEKMILPDKGRRISVTNPNGAVKFNEDSIDRTRKESLALPGGERRKSIKTRQLTPRPSGSIVDGNLEEEGDIGKAKISEESITPPIEDENNFKIKKQRRPTPFFPKSVQQQIIDEYNKGLKAGELIKLNEEEEIEEDDEEEVEEEQGEDEDDAIYGKVSSERMRKMSNETISSFNEEEKWSSEFLKKVKSITNEHEKEVERNEDFSELTEAEIMYKIQCQNDQDMSIRENLSEYPTETEFIRYMNACHKTKNGSKDEKILMNLINRDDLGPGILELYNSIQNDILKLLTISNKDMGSSEALPSLSNTWQKVRPSSAKNRSRASLTSPTTNNTTERICNKMSYDQMSDGNVSPHLQSESSYNTLPKIESSNRFLTGCTNSKSSIRTSPNISNPDIELPIIHSPILSRRSVNISPRGSKSRTPSLPSIKSSHSSSSRSSKNVLKIGQVSRLPSLKRSMSMLLTNLAQSADDNQIRSVETEESLLTNDEPEVVLRSPDQFADIAQSVTNTMKSSTVMDSKSSRQDIISKMKPSVLRSKSLSNQGSVQATKGKQASISLATIKRLSTSKSSSQQISRKEVLPKESLQKRSVTKSIPHYAAPLKRESINETSLSKESSSVISNNNMSISTINDVKESVFDRLSTEKKSDKIPKSSSEETAASKQIDKPMIRSKPSIAKSNKSLNSENADKPKIRSQPSIAKSNKSLNSETFGDKSNHSAVVSLQNQQRYDSNTVVSDRKSSKTVTVRNDTEKENVTKSNMKIKDSVVPYVKSSTSGKLTSRESMKATNLDKVGNKNKRSSEVSLPNQRSYNSKTVIANGQTAKSTSVDSTSQSVVRSNNEKEKVTKSNMKIKDSVTITLSSRKSSVNVKKLSNKKMQPSTSTPKADRDKNISSRSTISKEIIHKDSKTNTGIVKKKSSVKTQSIVEQTSSTGVIPHVKSSQKMKKKKSKKNLSKEKVSSKSSMITKSSKEISPQNLETEKDIKMVDLISETVLTAISELDHVETVEKDPAYAIATDVPEDPVDAIITDVPEDPVDAIVTDVAEVNTPLKHHEDIEIHQLKEEIIEPEIAVEHRDTAVEENDINAYSDHSNMNPPATENTETSTDTVNDVSDEEVNTIAKIPSKKSKLAAVPLSTVSVNFDDSLSAIKADVSPKTNSSPRPKSNRRSRSKERKSTDKIDRAKSPKSPPSDMKFKPSPPPGPRPTSMFMSQSLKSMVNSRSMRNVNKSKSLGSAGKVLPKDSRHRHYSSSFRESIPMLPLNESGYQDFTEMYTPSITDVRNRRSTSKTSSAMWVPQQSFIQGSSSSDLEKVSSSAVLVQTAQPPSREESVSSFTSGHIFVTPAASINFVTSTHSDNARNSSAASKTSVNESVEKQDVEVVERQVSGIELSQQSSLHSTKCVSKENINDTPISNDDDVVIQD